MKNKWFKTDDTQWCKKNDNYNFTFCEIVWLDTTSEDEKAENSIDEYDNYCVMAAWIDLMDYDLEEIERCIAAYGYKNVADVVDLYMDKANQIIAECLFEETCMSDACVVSKEILSETDAKKFAEEWMEEY